MDDYQDLKDALKIVAAGHHTLEGIGTDTTKGTVTNQDGKQHHVKLSGTIVPGFGQHMFSISSSGEHGYRSYF